MVYIKMRRAIMDWEGLSEVWVGGQGQGGNMGRITNIKAFGKCHMKTYYCRSFLNIYANA